MSCIKIIHIDANKSIDMTTEGALTCYICKQASNPTIIMNDDSFSKMCICLVCWSDITQKISDEVRKLAGKR